MAGGDFLNRRNQRLFAQGISGLGIALLYMSFYAAFEFYHLIPNVLAFALLAATTAIGATLALHYDALPVAALGLFGGYLTPVLVRPAAVDSVRLHTPAGCSCHRTLPRSQLEGGGTARPRRNGGSVRRLIAAKRSVPRHVFSCRLLRAVHTGKTSPYSHRDARACGRRARVCIGRSSVSIFALLTGAGSRGPRHPTRLVTGRILAGVRSLEARGPTHIRRARPSSRSRWCFCCTCGGFIGAQATWW